MIILRQKQYTRAEKEAMFQLMRLTKGFKSLPKELNSVENAKRFKKFSNRLVKFANDPDAHKFTAEELKEMKGFLSDIGATKFADNFEPIINKYYGGNNVEAWKRLRFKEENLPVKALVNRIDRLSSKSGRELIIQDEVESYNNSIKSAIGKSSKEIFSSPEGRLMKKIIKGEAGGVGQPSFNSNNVKGRDKMANILVNSIEGNLTKKAKKELLRKERVKLRRGRDFLVHDKGINGDYGNVFISSADPAILSHELGHGKSLADSIKAGTPYKERVGPRKISEQLTFPVRDNPVRDKANMMYARLDNLSVIAEENMANAYGRDIIRKYGGKNVDKHLADYEKMVDNLNMKSYLSGARKDDLTGNFMVLSDIYWKKR